MKNYDLKIKTFFWTAIIVLVFFASMVVGKIISYRLEVPFKLSHEQFKKINEWSDQAIRAMQVCSQSNKKNVVVFGRSTIKYLAKSDHSLEDLGILKTIKEKGRDSFCFFDVVDFFIYYDDELSPLIIERVLEKLTESRSKVDYIIFEELSYYYNVSWFAPKILVQDAVKEIVEKIKATLKTSKKAEQMSSIPFSSRRDDNLKKYLYWKIENKLEINRSEAIEFIRSSIEHKKRSEVFNWLSWIYFFAKELKKEDVISLFSENGIILKDLTPLAFEESPTYELGKISENISYVKSKYHLNSTKFILVPHIRNNINPIQAAKIDFFKYNDVRIINADIGEDIKKAESYFDIFPDGTHYNRNIINKIAGKITKTLLSF